MGRKQFSPLFNISGAIKNIAVHMGGAGSLIIGMLHISPHGPAFVQAVFTRGTGSQVVRSVGGCSGCSSTEEWGQKNL